MFCTFAQSISKCCVLVICTQLGVFCGPSRRFLQCFGAGQRPTASRTGCLFPSGRDGAVDQRDHHLPPPASPSPGRSPGPASPIRGTGSDPFAAAPAGGAAAGFEVPPLVPDQLQGVLGMFSPIGRRRHVIHDQSYLDRVLEAEFGDRHLPSSSPTPSVSPSSRVLTEASSAPEELLRPTVNEAKDLPS